MTDTVGHLLGFSLLGVSLASDLVSRRIPNAVILAGLCTGILFRLWAAGPAELLPWLSDAGFILLLTVPFYVTGALGAGDCKLMLVLSAFFRRRELCILYGTALILGAALGAAAIFHRLQRVRFPACPEGAKVKTTVPFAGCLAAGAVMLCLFLK